jgi:F-type H+-transporting ATPase subunit a
LNSTVLLTLAEDDLLSHVLPHPVMEVGGLTITNHMLMGLVAAALVLVIFAYVASRVRTKGDGIDAYVTKGRVAQTFEVICVYLRENVARPNLGDLTDKYIYYIWTVFFFVLFCNLLGMVPIGPIAALIMQDPHASHIAGTATSNLNVTGSLALISFIAIIGVGVHEQGVSYFKHFAPVPFKPWPMIPLAVFLIVLESAGLVIKVVVLAMRLFGNMLAGHLVLAALIAMIFTFAKVSALLGYSVGIGVMVGATAISILELFVAFLQAFIFTFLTVLFIAAGAVHHGEHGHDEAHAHAEAH